MKIEIINIKPQVGNVFDALVGKRTYTFQIMIEKWKLGTDELLNVSNNRDLWETLRYNVPAISKIHRLAQGVLQWIGCFLTRDDKRG